MADQSKTGRSDDTAPIKKKSYRRDLVKISILCAIVGGMMVTAKIGTALPTAVHYILHAGIIVLTIVGVAKGAEWLVESAVRIANRFGLSPLVIGLTVVAFGTSAPEFAVSVSAGIQDHGSVAIGNIVGSNIFNLGFILGGVALVTPVVVARRVVFRDGAFLMGSAILLFVFLLDYRLDWWEGLIMFVGLWVYMGFLLFGRALTGRLTKAMSRRSRPADAVAAAGGSEVHGTFAGSELKSRVMFPSTRTEAAEPPEDVELEDIPTEKATLIDIPILLVGLALTIIGCHFMVESAIWYAHALSISEYAIGVTIVAAGTSAPEMAVSLVAALRGHHGLSAGNLIGSDIFNVLGVLGLAAMLNQGVIGTPLSIDPADQKVMRPSATTADPTPEQPGKPSDKQPEGPHGTQPSDPKEQPRVESEDIQMPADKTATKPADAATPAGPWGFPRLMPAQWSILALIGMIGLTVFFMWTGFRINRFEAGILFGIAIMRWVFDLMAR